MEKDDILSKLNCFDPVHTQTFGELKPKIVNPLGWTVNKVAVEFEEHQARLRNEMSGITEFHTGGKTSEFGAPAVGDLNSQAKGSGARFNSGKPDYSMIPMHLLEEIALVFMYGAKKYDDWNWAKGMKWSVPFACMMRHSFRFFFLGERNDKESGYSHLAHIGCNLLMLMHYEKFFPEGDDRPNRFFS